MPVELAKGWPVNLKGKNEEDLHGGTLERPEILLNYVWNILQDRLFDRPLKSLNKFKRIDIIQSMYSDTHGIKIEINDKRKLQVGGN